MRKLLLMILVSITCFSCGKSGDVVPSVPINYTGQKFSPPLNKLSNGGPPQFISGYGVAGLVIYKSIQGTYRAYDRCSSYQPEKKCAVNVDDTGLSLIDPCSGSKFSLEDGSPVKAPATHSLRSYQVIETQFTIQVLN
ncbi:hypothetical protein ACFFGT_14695 [Mucilaginibacter angelicae]|uniref:Rieske domain-containing protein n=1 Tax=Mucilaginibacter angelicae TaxID=869718 RepID=A0ABV6L7Q0_9SPHI